MSDQRAAEPAYRDVRLPTKLLGNGAGRHRVLGGMWHSQEEAVTLLVFPDHADDCRALITVTADEAERFAKHLLQLAQWTREYVRGE